MFVTFFGEAVLEVQGTGTKIGMLAIGLGWRSFLVIFRCDAAFKRFFGFLAINIPVLCTCEIKFAEWHSKGQLTGNKKIGRLEYWNIGMMECWGVSRNTASVGECWKNGMMEW